MAITGISALSGQQIIASGACSARSAATASYTTGGDDLQGLYTTVNSNSGNWNTPLFPSNITADSLHINNNGDITLLQQTGDDSDDYAQTVIHGSGIEFIIGQTDPTVVGTIAGNDISNWNSTYNTVSTNSGSWTGGGAGIEYSGIAPIAVNNVSHEISADMSNYVLLSSTATQTLSSRLITNGRIELAGARMVGSKIYYDPFKFYRDVSAGAPAQRGEFSFLIDNNANLTISASAQQEPYIRIGSYSGGSYGYNEINRAAIQKWNSTLDTVSSNSASWAEGGSTGIEYSGISPIVVNNVSHEISADAKTFTVGNGISAFDDTANNQVIISVTGKQNALTDVSDIVVTASLPVSPVSSTLYLIPEA
jgi:hypothetical protein